jgi:hypothetical protein
MSNRDMCVKLKVIKQLGAIDMIYFCGALNFFLRVLFSLLIRPVLFKVSEKKRRKRINLNLFVLLMSLSLSLSFHLHMILHLSMARAKKKKERIFY